jgi:protein-S-isoprenylcysteine O-methyltransferase Ste14
MFKKAWSWVLLFSLAASAVVTWYIQFKGRRLTLGLAAVLAGSVVGRGLFFFAVTSAPLFRQPRLKPGWLPPALGTVISALGTALILAATRELSRTSFSGMRGIPAKVVTAGPYRFVRHPATIGFVASYAGWCLAWRAVYALASVPVLALLLALETFWEERDLVRSRGEEYLAYRRRTGMYLPKGRRRPCQALKARTPTGQLPMHCPLQ